MKTSKLIYLFIAVMIGFLGMASTAEACAANEWCCKRDFNAPGNPCIKCCPKNQAEPGDLSGTPKDADRTAAKLQACKQSSSDPLLLSRADVSNPGGTVADNAVQHGSWHPCAEDPDACGSGHVCCAGHCIYGSTCGGN